MPLLSSKLRTSEVHLRVCSHAGRSWMPCKATKLTHLRLMAVQCCCLRLLKLNQHRPRHRTNMLMSLWHREKSVGGGIAHLA